MNSVVQALWRHRRRWLPPLVLVLVLVVTFLLVPKAAAPFIYQFF